MPHPMVSRPAPVTGLSHVQLLVSDVQVSAHWYATTLGLEKYAEDLAVGYVALRHRDARIVVVLTAGGDGDQPEPGRGRLDHLAFAVPDDRALQAWADHLDDVGIAHPGVVSENGNLSLQLRDPDGIAIELVAPGRAPV